MTSDVALTSALRNNLLSLQSTQRQMDTTQFRLSTGKKVNSALDNPLNFFRAQSFGNRASDLTTLMDGINLSIRTIEEADKGITAINKLLDNSESIIEEAKSAYNGQSSTVANLRAMRTATGLATSATTLGAIVSGGFKGFDAGDEATITINANNTTYSLTLTSASTLGAIIAAVTAGGNLGGGATFGAFLTASFDGATGGLSIGVANNDFAAFDDITISVTNGAGADEMDPVVNVGGTIIRETSGESTIYSGIQTTINGLQDRYDKILTEISATAKDASFNGINLLRGNDLLTTFNEDGTSNLSTTGDDMTAEGLKLSTADFQSRANLDTRGAELKAATAQVRNFGGMIATDLSLIQTRRDFTSSTIETLKAGADDLTLADLNEEGANLLALQTRQQLGVTSLSLASQAQQSVLRLF